MVRIMPPGEGHSTVIFASHAKRNNPNAVYIVQKGFLHAEAHRVQELCESRGGRPGLFILTSLMFSADVKLY